MVSSPELLDANFACLIVRGQLGSSKAMLDELVRRVDASKIHPVIAKSFEWGEAKAAFELLMNQSEVGKIVVKGPSAGSV